jgi:hypothetical protein
MSGFSNRYGKSSTPHERAAMAMIKRKKKVTLLNLMADPLIHPKTHRPVLMTKDTTLTI